MLVFYAMPCDASEQLRAAILGQKGNAATAAKRAKLLANNRAAIVPRKQEVRVGKLHSHTQTHTETEIETERRRPVFLLAVAKLNFVLIWP